MNEHDPSEDDGVIAAGIFTRLRPFAGWFFIATAIVGLAWAVLSLVGMTA
jgi:hypothetical protein